MRLKRLVVHGFKSFADKTEFDFDANLTGIVGPNGCGKSNVVDALKWVLGDQRAKSLRGTEMTDVIFKGAEGRASMSEAKVTVVLEASGPEKAAPEGEGGPLEGRSEVSIGRRLTTDKESEYLLNDEGMRLKDVRDLLMDTGLGVGAYSVMEQGRIDAVLSANPEERRSIFEEAAGISRFKLQKRETLRKLERTEQNLARVHDLIEERTKRIRGLKIQAGKARRWQELTTELRDLKSALAVLEARTLRAQQHERAEALATHGKALHELEEARCLAQQTVATHEDEIARLQRLVDEVRAKQHAVESDKRSHEERAETLATRAEELRADAEQGAERIEALREQREERQKALTDATERGAELAQQIVALQEQLEAQRETLRDKQRAARDLVEARERARELVMEQMRALTALRNQAHDQLAEKRALDGRRERLEAKTAAALLPLEELAREGRSLRLLAAELGDRADLCRAEELECLESQGQRDDAARELARQEAELRERLSACTSQTRLLEDMALHLEGLDEGPRFLLQQRPPGLLGSLAELLDIDVDLSKALEAALGPFVQALVVDTREHADAMLSLLRSGKHGRALLLVQEEFEVQRDAPCVFDQPPCAHPLATSVRCPQRARPLVDWLLRGVCLVDSLAEADKDRQDLMFVTRDGSVSCGPRLEGGQGKGEGVGATMQGGPIAQRALRARLEQEARGLEERLATLGRRYAEAQGLALETKQRLARIAEQRGNFERQRSDTETKIARAHARSSDLERELAALRHELAEVGAARLLALATLGQRLLGALLLERSERRAAAGEAAAAAAHAEAQRLAAEAGAFEQELRVRIAQSHGDRDGTLRTAQIHERALFEIDAGIVDQERRRGEAFAASERAVGDATRAREHALLCSREIEALGEQRGEREDALAQARTLVEEQKHALSRLDARRGELAEMVTQERLALGELEHRFARVEERLREETQVELLRCLAEVDGLGLVTADEPGPEVPAELMGLEMPERLLGPPLPEAMTAPELQLQRLWERPDFAPAESAIEVTVLQGQLDRLGSVNLDAVRELAQEESDFTQLEREVLDLTQARKSLIEALRKMEAESRALFESTFEQARQNFKAIFRKLFQGGHADMFLTAPKREQPEAETTAASFDALECGIEIVAKPPGKELQSINLLSGGERSLTALAILFAVFKVKPSPFCILDEVDAALDETNVERFLRVLRDFVGPTQFCIVTHHKRTMAECQVLYGISMQKKGVSSRIAVALSEVDDLHAGNVVTTQAADTADTAAPGGSEHVEPANRIAQTHGNPLKRRIAGEEPVGF